MMMTLAIVPNPGRSRSGNQTSSTTQLMSAVAQPIEIDACLAIPWAKTVQGDAPHWLWTSRPSPTPKALSPPTSGATIRGRIDHVEAARQGVTGMV